MSKRADLLNKAINIVDGERKDRYGEPEDAFKTIAMLWSCYCNHDLTAIDVANMMMLLKIARSINNPEYQDNYIDIAGYAACAGEIAAGVDDGISDKKV